MPVSYKSGKIVDVFDSTPSPVSSMNSSPSKRHQLIREHTPDAIAHRLKRPGSPQYISDAILGGIDGCVTTFAVVSGTVGAGLPATIALVLGFANLLADGFSMAISNYESIKAQQEFKDSLRQSEQMHIDQVPAGEREEIRQIFQQKGFKGEALDQVVETICKDPDVWIETMLTEEHGIQKAASNPCKSAAITFLAFLLVGAIPLIPFLIPDLAPQRQFLFSAGLAGLMFFTIGTLKSMIVSKPAIRTGLKTLFTGGTAAGLAFLAGHILREIFGIGGI